MKLLNLLLAFLLVIVPIVNLFPADNYNQTTDVFNESPVSVTYKVTFTMSDSTGNYYSESLYIGDANTSDGSIYISQLNVAGTEDVDYTLQTSHDGSSNWTTAADELTQVGTTAINDTLGIIDGANDWNFHNKPWLRIKADGQAGNPQTTVTIYVTLVKVSAGEVYRTGKTKKSTS
jgi:hypothetical protein